MLFDTKPRLSEKKLPPKCQQYIKIKQSGAIAQFHKYLKITSGYISPVPVIIDAQILAPTILLMRAVITESPLASQS